MKQAFLSAKILLPEFLHFLQSSRKWEHGFCSSYWTRITSLSFYIQSIQKPININQQQINGNLKSLLPFEVSRINKTNGSDISSKQKAGISMKYV